MCGAIHTTATIEFFRSISDLVDINLETMKKSFMFFGLATAKRRLTKPGPEDKNKVTLSVDAEGRCPNADDFNSFATLDKCSNGVKKVELYNCLNQIETSYKTMFSYKTVFRFVISVIGYY